MNSLPQQSDQNAITSHSKSTIELIESSISQSTHRAYAGALGRLDTYIRSEQLDLTDSNLAGYLTHLFEAGKSPATCSLVVAAVQFRCKIDNVPSPCGRTTERVLTGIRRKGIERGRGQSNGLTYEQVITILSTNQTRRQYGRKLESPERAKVRSLVDNAIISLSFMAGMRRSEIANLEWRDISPGKNQTLLIQVRQSKTDQEGKNQDFRLLKNGCADSIRALQEHVGEIDPHAKVVGLNGQSINLRIKAAVSNAGFDMAKITSHSGRIGLASELTSRGASISAIALCGGWRSPQMVIHYSRQAQTERGAIAKYF